MSNVIGRQIRETYHTVDERSIKPKKPDLIATDSITVLLANKLCFINSEQKPENQFVFEQVCRPVWCPHINQIQLTAK